MFDRGVALYEPISVYKPIAEGIGIVDGPLVFMSYPILSFISIPFSTRMTVVRLGSGELWLHSPIAYDSGLAGGLGRMGRVVHLVSPNLLHYAHIQEWEDHSPNTIAWASPGVRERAKKQGMEVHFDRDLGVDAPPEWADDLLQTTIPGSFLDEIVFFHKASRTLILTDTIQNFELSKLRGMFRTLTRWAGAYDPHGQMPIDLRSTFLPRKYEIRPVVQQMLSWQPERIILSHGKCIDSDADKALRYAFRWAL